MRRAGSLPIEGAPLPALGDVLDFLRLIWRVDHALQRTSKRMENTLGITAPQRLVIRIVGRFPSIAAGYLAKLLHVHPGTLSGILKRVESHGLISRRSDPRDGRRVLLGVTAKGRSLDVASEGTVEAAIQQVLETATKEKVGAAREVLESIALALDGTVTDPDNGCSEQSSSLQGRPRRSHVSGRGS